MSDEQHILPYYDVMQIPSCFMGYPSDTTISVRPFTFGEQLNLQKKGSASQSLINMFSTILDGVKTNIPKNSLTPQDVLYLGTYRKIVSTKHDKVIVETRCPNCLNTNKSVFTLKQLPFKSPQFTKLPIRAELDKHILYFGLLTVKQFNECVKNHNGESLAMLAMQVTKIVEKNEDLPEEECKTYINDDSDKFYTQARFIIGSALDLDKEVLDEVSFMLEDYGLKPVDITCEDEFCKNQYTISIEQQDVLVYPFRNDTESVRSRIRFC